MNYFLLCAVIVLCYMSFWFTLSLIKRRNDVVDIAWGLGFVLLSWTSLLVSEIYNYRGIIVGILVSIWGLRLSSHIYKRNKDKPEDYRYLVWRQTWGKWFYLRSYLQIYILQGIFLFLISLPILIINKNIAQEIGVLDI